MAAPSCPDCGKVRWTKDGRCPECDYFPSLGYQVVQWIESHCAIPDREDAGKPFLLTDEQYDFIVRFYRLNPNAGKPGVQLPFTFYRGAQLTRPQKWGKGPLAASIICNEGQGPSRFDGWDAHGQPVGKPCPTPWIELTAISEAQTLNVWSSLVPMIRLGALNAHIPDTGETRINIQGGGVIRPVTAAPNSRLGAKVTFALEDEIQSWLESNRGRKIADTQRRNLGGMGGRFLATGNAWDPNENSVAQATFELKEEGVLFDDVEPPEGSIRDARFRKKAIRAVYGDSLSGSVRYDANGAKSLEIPGWVSIDRIDSEIRVLLDRDPTQAERYFLNRKQAGESKAFSAEQWGSLAKPKDMPTSGLIVLGVDGARFKDALAIVATHVESGYQWPVGIWERPEKAPKDYEHPIDEVDGAMIDTFENFTVWRALVDPQYIEFLVERWQGRWGNDVVVPFFTNRPRTIAPVIRQYTEAINHGDFRHSGDPVFTSHIANAVKSPLNFNDEHGRPFWTLAKERHDSPLRIDGAMGGAISWEARGQAIAADAQEPAEGTWYF